MNGCPIGINIPGFIRSLREGDVKGAFAKIREKNPFPSICGRICSAPCEIACVLNEEHAPIGIRGLERYASDFGRQSLSKQKPSSNGKKIAIIGSGPSGLAASYELANKGYQVTVFEALDQAGGVLRYGIPEFRIPKKILDQEINELKTLGVDIQTSVYLGQTVTIDELLTKGFKAVLLATGAGIPKFMELPGTHLGGVYYGEEFLMRVNLIKPGLFSKGAPDFSIGSKIAVIGSGNTALDCARACKRFDCEVTLVFRRTEEEMWVRKEERELGKEEGIIFEPLVKPIEIQDNGNQFVSGLKCVRLDYAHTDDKSKWDLLEVPESQFTLDVDTVIMAVGHKPNSLIKNLSQAMTFNPDGSIKIDPETFQTSIPKVFACGNVVTNAGPIVEAIASGKKAAEKMIEFLK